MTTLDEALRALEKAVELVDRAVPGHWNRDNDDTHFDRITICGDNRYACSVQIHQTPRHMGAMDEGERVANSAAIVAAVNFIREHGRALLTTRQEVAPVAIDDDKLLELLRKHFLKSGHRNRDAYEAMTYEKSPEMFPQATYDVPTCAVTAFVQDCVAAFASTGQTSDARDCPARFFASGPDACFFTDSAQFAEDTILAHDYDRDDWTVTDLYAAMQEAGK